MRGLLKKQEAPAPSAPDLAYGVIGSLGTENRPEYQGAPSRWVPQRQSRPVSAASLMIAPGPSPRWPIAGLKLARPYPRPETCSVLRELRRRRSPSKSLLAERAYDGRRYWGITRCHDLLRYVFRGWLRSGRLHSNDAVPAKSAEKLVGTVGVLGCVEIRYGTQSTLGTCPADILHSMGACPSTRIRC